MKIIYKLYALFVLVACVQCASSNKANQVPTQKDMAAYLMVYFKDDTHGIYMALNKDGYSFTDVNGGKPLLREGFATQPVC